jgi:hypothetical protein
VEMGKVNRLTLEVEKIAWQLHLRPEMKEN